MANDLLRMETKGIKALEQSLKDYPKEFGKALRPIMRNGMKLFVLPQVKRTIAVLTGLMRSRTKVRAAKNSRGNRLARGKFGSAVTVVNVPYSRYVLLNNKLRDGSIRKGDRTLRNALYDNEERLRQHYVSEGSKASDKVANEVRRKNKGKKDR